MASYFSEQNTSKLSEKELLDSLVDVHMTAEDKAVVIQELTRKNLLELKGSIDSFNSSSEKYSRRILYLTWVLVVETALMLIPIFSEIFGLLK